jgi:membrane-bound ClpP family serine protease
MKKRLELYGWLLFLVGILLWVIQTVLAGDILGMLGGVAWLIGCSLFILSYKIKSI